MTRTNNVFRPGDHKGRQSPLSPQRLNYQCVIRPRSTRAATSGQPMWGHFQHLCLPVMCMWCIYFCVCGVFIFTPSGFNLFQGKFYSKWISIEVSTVNFYFLPTLSLVSSNWVLVNSLWASVLAEPTSRFIQPHTQSTVPDKVTMTVRYIYYPTHNGTTQPTSS